MNFEGISRVLNGVLLLLDKAVKKEYGKIEFRIGHFMFHLETREAEEE